MKRLLGQAFVIATLGGIATAFTPACAEDDQAIFIQMVFAPPQNRQNGGCLYTPDPTQPMISIGELDIGCRDTYDAMLLVGSQLIVRGDTANVRAESNRAHVNGAVVRVTDANGGAISEFTTIGSSFLQPQLNNTPAYAALGITAIDAQTAQKLADQLPPAAPGQPAPSKLVVANMKVFGKTLGGVDLESGEFQFPIRVCNGCKTVFAGGDDPTHDGLDCSLPLGGVGGTTPTVLPCRPGQDETTPCQLCPGTRAVH